MFICKLTKWPGALLLLTLERLQNTELKTESKCFETFSKYITRKLNITFNKIEKIFHFVFTFLFFFKQILKRKFTNTQKKAEILCKEKTFDCTSLFEHIWENKKLKNFIHFLVLFIATKTNRGLWANLLACSSKTHRHFTHYY